ncbi:hypothetical protein, partial [Brevibacillus sp. NRS-1366]|uniref:hypothetical protein n=1 Tax=Brevibacillus sp. NRS-1366 TaxID=3233899 RepID=UPI003D21B75D
VVTFILQEETIFLCLSLKKGAQGSQSKPTFWTAPFCFIVGGNGRARSGLLSKAGIIFITMNRKLC